MCSPSEREQAIASQWIVVTMIVNDSYGTVICKFDFNGEYHGQIMGYNQVHGCLMVFFQTL